MKKIILLYLLFMPSLLFAQKVITLTVNQPPEFGFSVSNTETTITKGSSVILGAGLLVQGGSGAYSYRWSPGKTLNDSTILHPSATPSDTTNYLLTVTDKNGCSFTVGYKVNVNKQTVSAGTIQAGNNLEAVLFPNPNGGKFKIKLSGKPTEIIELAIFSNNGELIKKQVIRKFTGDHIETLDLKLAAGVYTLQIMAGSEVMSRQFVIN